MAKPFYSLPRVVSQIQGDWQWIGPDISYSFPDAANGNKDENAGFTAMTGFQIGMARAAYDLWDDVIAFNLNETSGWGADITMAYSSKTDKDGSYTSGYENQEQIWYSTTDTDMIPQNAYYSQAGMWGYLHEIGHALGLDHPGPYGAFDPAHPGDDFNKDAAYRQDTFQYTVMSYFKAGDNGTGTDHTGTVDGTTRYIYPSTPMLDDIATVQWMYGADMQTRIGATTYGFHNTSGRDAFDFVKNAAPVVTIWDAGGNDTLDLTGFHTRQVVDLNPGAFSSISDAGITNNLAMSYAVDARGNIQGLDAGFNINTVVNYIENAKGGSGNDDITGNAAKNVLEGNDGDDKLYGAQGDDTLYGGAGNDELHGGAGNDAMYGGSGNDIYYVEEAGDTVNETRGFLGLLDAGGIDEVRTWRTTETLGRFVENLTYLGATLTSQDFTGTGNGLANVITGGYANDKLYGLGGADTLKGGVGNDILDGGTEADIMYGGAGNDTYYVDNVGDQVIEYTRAGRRFTDSGGIDEVKTTLADYSLGLYVENLTFTGTGAFHGIGNDLDNVMRGGSGADTLEGGKGNDTFYGGRGSNRLVGGEGNDTYHVGPLLYYGSNTIVEDANGGTDTVVYHAISSLLSFGHTLAANVENLTIVGSYNANGTGNALDNVMIGNAGENTLRGLEGNDTLDGGDGFDTLIGGLGNDTYRVTSTIYQKPDTIVEEANEGTDTVIYTPVSSLSSITPSYTLGANLENLTLGGTLDADGTGNELDNVIVGNAQSNTLSGLGGNDTLDGGLGFDTLLGGEGDDTLVGTYQYSVYGVDVMDGGAGIDTADFSHHGNAVWIDLAYDGREVWTRDNAGLDTGAWRQVADLVSVENLTGSAGNDYLAGNGEANTVYGNGGNDTIFGQGGNDILSGGFRVESDSRGEDGDDTVDGGSGDDTIMVSYGHDTIRGGDGIDTLSFAWTGDGVTVDLGLGNVTFRESGGWVEEFGGGGWSTLATATWSGMENLTGGHGSDTLTGDAGANRIEGGEGADTITGGLGDDVLAGGDGADLFGFGDGWMHDTIIDYTHLIDHIDMRHVSGLWSFDQLLIAATAQGAEIDFGGGAILLSGVDAATLDASDFLFAEKPAGQAITGTEGDDVLAGTLGDDQIHALGGSDVISNVDNGDTVDGGDGYDFVYAGPQTVNTGFHFTAAGTNVEYVTGNDGNDVIDAAGNNGFVQTYGNAGDDLLIGGTGEDWMFGGQGTDTAQFSGNMADYNILEDYGAWTGWTALIDKATGDIDWVISVEKLKFADVTIDAPNARPEMIGTSGADAIAAGATRAEIFGLDGDDKLAGGDGDDFITGGLGADTMSGGAGSDVLFIDNADTVYGGTGYDYAWADDTKGPIGLQFNAAGKSIEFVWGGMGNDVIDASGVTLSEFNYGLSVQSMNGDDTMIGSSFSDTFIGGDGVDTMVFAGNRENYTVGAPDQYGNVFVTDIATGAQDLLNGVEMMKFANGTWAL